MIGWLARPAASVVELPDLLVEVAAALEAGDICSVRHLLFRVDLPACNDYWRDCERENASRHSPDAHAGRSKFKGPKAVSVSMRRRLGERDAWRCRYCGLRVVSPEFLKRLETAMPEAFPDGPGMTRSGLNPMWRVIAQVGDHVVPLSAGGPNSIENLVTSCWPCNFAAKADCTLEELQAPPMRPLDDVVHDDWDGLRSRGAKQ